MIFVKCNLCAPACVILVVELFVTHTVGCREGWNNVVTQCLLCRAANFSCDFCNISLHLLLTWKGSGKDSEYMGWL